MLNSTYIARLRKSNARRYVLLGGGIALVSYLGYRAYASDSINQSKAYFRRLRAALQKYVDALAAGGEICSSLARDLQTFLESEGDQVPNSVRQLAKLLQSPEVAATTTSTVTAVYRGISGPSSSSQHPNAPQQQPALDKILDALLSDRGHSLVSVAVSMGAKNIVASYLETTQRLDQQQAAARNQSEEEVHIIQGQGLDTTDKLFNFLSSQAGQHLAVMAVAALASNGMRVYMDKSLEVNLYEDLFSSMAKPAHLNAVKQCVGVFAKDIVSAYLNSGGGGGGGSGNNNSNDNDNNINQGMNILQAAAALPPAPQLTPFEFEEIHNEQHQHQGVIDGGAANGNTSNDENDDEEERRQRQQAGFGTENGIGHGATTSNGTSAADAVSIDEEEHTNDNLKQQQQEQRTNTSSSLPSSTTASPQQERISAAWAQHDDLDSDGLLHESRTARGFRGARPKPAAVHPRVEHSAVAKIVKNKDDNNQQQQHQWVSVVGKEWLNVVKDPAGRDAMLSIVNSATKEVVQGVAQVASERLSTEKVNMVWFIVVLFLGVATALLMQVLLRSLGSATGLLSG